MITWPALSVVEKGICWTLPHSHTAQDLYQEICNYVHRINYSLLPDTIDLVAMWKNLTAGTDMYSLHVGDLLAHTMHRIITKPSGAAQVERAVSVVTDVLSKKRLSLADHTLAHTTFFESQVQHAQAAGHQVGDQKTQAQGIERDWPFLGASTAQPAAHCSTAAQV